MSIFNLLIHYNEQKGTIKPELYGSFAEHLGRCIYDGIYVGKQSGIENIDGIRLDIVEALKAINIPVLRWPGGCFADEYHWRDGIGNERKRTINTHWGGAIEDNSFGTHEFMQLCELLQCSPYIAGNVGSGSVQEMSEWVEYICSDSNSTTADERRKNGRQKPWKLKYLGVGNENWNCGGNMRSEFYADQYNRYSTFCKDHGESRLYKIACGPCSADYEWTEQFMKNLKAPCDGISLHHYSNVDEKAQNLSREQYNALMIRAAAMEPLIINHMEIIRKYDSKQNIKLVVDEWGTWYAPEDTKNNGMLYQQNTMTDAMVAAVTLNIFNKYCNYVDMANIAQTVNVLQAVILTKDDKLLKTPTYHVFDMFKQHQGSQLLESDLFWVESPLDKQREYMSYSASINAQGNILLTIANTDIDNTHVGYINVDYDKYDVRAEILHSDSYLSANTFDNLNNVVIKNMKLEAKSSAGCKITLPPCSLVAVHLDNK